MILIDKENIFSSIEYLKIYQIKLDISHYFPSFFMLFSLFTIKRINVFSDSITKPIIDLSNQTSQISEK